MEDDPSGQDDPPPLEGKNASCEEGGTNHGGHARGRSPSPVRQVVQAHK
jgi:hypothetical protein